MLAAQLGEGLLLLVGQRLARGAAAQQLHGAVGLSQLDADELADQVAEVVGFQPDRGPGGIVAAVGEHDGPRLGRGVADAAEQLRQQ
jgi:hypothetical protein